MWDLPEKGYKRILALSALFFVGGAFVFLLVHLLSSCLLPFVLAWLLAFALEKPIGWISRKLHVAPKGIALFVLLALVLSLGGILCFLILRIFGEARSLLSYLYGNIDSYTDRMAAIGEKAEAFFRVDEGKSNYFSGLLSSALQSAISGLSAKCTNGITGFLSHLPSFFLSFFVFLFSAFYFCSDYKGIMNWFYGLLPGSRAGKIERGEKKFLCFLGRYARAYLLILMITFSELYLALTLLRVDFALVIALIIALADILPVIGVGTVLVPWGLFEWATGGKFLGIGLLVTYGVIAIVRELIEPHVIGAEVGLHPLATVAALYIGLKAGGIGGLLLSPFAAMAVKYFLESVRGEKEGNT